MINMLDHLNAKDGRSKDEVKSFVRDMLRVFAHEVGFFLNHSIIFKNSDRLFLMFFMFVFLHFLTLQKQGFSAVGFSGDIGDGPKTAYDALPPKLWKTA